MTKWTKRISEKIDLFFFNFQRPEREVGRFCVTVSVLDLGRTVGSESTGIDAVVIDRDKHEPETGQ